jgi:hypothetical protein
MDLIMAAERGARIAVDLRRAEGLDNDAIRTRIVVGFRERFDALDCGEFQLESLMAAVQRGVDSALG